MMRVRVRKVVAVGVLAGMMALVGCGSPSIDTTAFEGSLDGIDGVNGSLVEIQHPGVPTNTDVAVWLFVDSADVDSVVTITREVAEIADADAAVSGQQVNLSVVKGDPADFPTRGDAVKSSASVMHRVAETLGLPESAGQMLSLTPKEIKSLAGTDG